MTSKAVPILIRMHSRGQTGTALGRRCRPLSPRVNICPWSACVSTALLLILSPRLISLRSYLLPLQEVVKAALRGRVHDEWISPACTCESPERHVVIQHVQRRDYQAAVWFIWDGADANMNISYCWSGMLEYCSLPLYVRFEVILQTLKMLRINYCSYHRYGSLFIYHFSCAEYKHISIV